MLITGFIRERIADEHLGVLFGTVQIASADLMTRDDHLARHTEGQAVEVLIDDILLHIEQRHTDRYALIQRFHGIHMGKDRTLCRAVAVVEIETARRLQRNQLFTADR